MNAELTYTLELARVFKSCVERSSALQERVGADLAFDRSLKRGHEAIIAMLRRACEELAPIRANALPNGGGQIAEFIEALEYGEVPAPKATTNGHESVQRNSTTDGTDFSGVVRARENDAEAHTGKKRARASHSKNNGAGSIESMRRSTGAESSVKLRARAPVSKKKVECVSARPPKPTGEAPELPSNEKSREVMSQWRVQQ
jgi:hypothetical protein